MAENVTAAIDAGAFAVPDADDAIMPRAGREVELLGAPDRGGCKILVHAGLEFDVVLVKMSAGRHQLLIIAAQRRPAVAGDEACGVEPCSTIAPNLRHWQAHKRLYARHENVAGFLRVFLIKTDQTLIDTHLALAALAEPMDAPPLFRALTR